jgi:hypothetical protein
MIERELRVGSQLTTAREAEKRWRSGLVEGIADRQLWTKVGEGCTWQR